MPKIEVAYVLLKRQFLKSLDVKLGASVSEAINLSGVLEEFPEINLDINPVGIYSKKVTLDSVVKDGDRIEIYRALQVSPKEARRLRAKNKQSRRS
ncbi:RnfH family protein [Gammaproteobacteria bacterium]|nr:RnfH family protein [Gammaproteobacteria bacterium]